jgi:hypothetical protein
VKTLDSVLKEGKWHAEVEESRGKHVSADPRGAIEMEMGSGHDSG